MLGQKHVCGEHGPIGLRFLPRFPRARTPHAPASLTTLPDHLAAVPILHRCTTSHTSVSIATATTYTLLSCICVVEELEVVVVKLVWRPVPEATSAPLDVGLVPCTIATNGPLRPPGGKSSSILVNLAERVCTHKRRHLPLIEANPGEVVHYGVGIVEAAHR